MENQSKESVKQRMTHTGAIAAPSLFTLGNLACGFFSILAATKGNFAHAGWLILIAAVFDKRHIRQTIFHSLCSDRLRLSERRLSPAP